MILARDPRKQWTSLSQSERDAAYDNNKAVIDSPALIAERNSASAILRESRKAFLDVPYAPGERTKSDIYPADDKSAPCLVFIHGGYWQRNSRDLFAMMVEGMSAHGWSVVIMGYTLAPDATMTQITSETRKMLDWLAKDGPSYGIVGPVVLSGWSAGAQMVAMALDHPIVTAGLAISGVYDLEPIRGTGLNAALQLTDDEIRLFSPLRLPVVQKPLIVAYGANELPALVHDSVNFHAVRVAANAQGDLLSVKDANHFTILQSLRQPGGELVAAVQRLVAHI